MVAVEHEIRSHTYSTDPVLIDSLTCGGYSKNDGSHFCRKDAAHIVSWGRHSFASPGDIINHWQHLVPRLILWEVVWDSSNMWGHFSEGL